MRHALSGPMRARLRGMAAVHRPICRLWPHSRRHGPRRRGGQHDACNRCGHAELHAQKFVVLALLGIFLSKLASMQDFLAALQSMGTPQAVLIPCMAILRFFPTIRRDASHLMESLKTRRVLAGGGFAFRHPALTCELLIVPLLMRSVRVSDELAASALARGLDGETQATVLQSLSFGERDVVAAAFTLLATGVLAWLQFGPR